MSLVRLIRDEARKLFLAPVFWVAPIVLAIYLGLMFFGYEMSAAKRGVSFSSAAPDEFSGSLVVDTYSSIRIMLGNVLGIARISPDLIKKLEEAQEKPVEEQPIVEQGATPEFDYWRIFFHSLIHPQPLPRPESCDDGQKKPEEPAAPAEPAVLEPGNPQGKTPQKGARLETGGLLSFFITDAYAAPAAVKKKVRRPQQQFAEDEMFSQRVKKRLEWMMASEDLQGALIDRSVFNGMRFTYLSMYFAFVFIFPLITIAVAAQVFTGEMAHGTLRTCLLRPVRRTQLIGAKVGLIFVYLTVLVFFFTLAALLLGVAGAGYGNLILDSDVIGNTGKVRMILGDGALLLFFASGPFIAFSLMPLALFAMLLSFVKPEPAYVIGITSIVYFILFSLGGLDLFKDIRFLFFTTYMDGWPLLYESPVNWPLLVLKQTMIFLIAAGLLAVIVRLFNRQDVYS